MSACHEFGLHVQRAVIMVHLNDLNKVDPSSQHTFICDRIGFSVDYYDRRNHRKCLNRGCHLESEKTSPCTNVSVESYNYGTEFISRECPFQLRRSLQSRFLHLLSNTLSCNNYHLIFTYTQFPTRILKTFAVHFQPSGMHLLNECVIQK